MAVIDTVEFAGISTSGKDHEHFLSIPVIVAWFFCAFWPLEGLHVVSGQVPPSAVPGITCRISPFSADFCDENLNVREALCEDESYSAETCVPSPEGNGLESLPCADHFSWVVSVFFGATGFQITTPITTTISSTLRIDPHTIGRRSCRVKPPVGSSSSSSCACCSGSGLTRTGRSTVWDDASPKWGKGSTGIWVPITVSWETAEAPRTTVTIRSPGPVPGGVCWGLLGGFTGSIGGAGAYRAARARSDAAACAAVGRASGEVASIASRAVRRSFGMLSCTPAGLPLFGVGG